MAQLLEVRNITKRFGGIVAVNNLSFNINEGETVGFIGPNGAGKSTVVNLLSGYLDADNGQIEMNGVNISRMKPYQRAHMGLARTCLLYTSPSPRDRTRSR